MRLPMVRTRLVLSLLMMVTGGQKQGSKGSAAGVPGTAAWKVEECAGNGYLLNARGIASGREGGSRRSVPRYQLGGYHSFRSLLRLQALRIHA